MATPSAARAPVTASKGIVGQVAANAGIIGGLTAGLVASGITNTYAQTAIMANVGKESGFKLESENMNYTSVDRLKKVFPSKFGKMSDAEASQYVKNPEKLGNFIYGGQYGNRDPEDGYKYRGRGSIGLTFRGQYESTAKEIGVPELATNPDLANDPEVNRKIVANYMIKNVGLKKLNEFTDQQTANRVITQAVGGKRLNLDVGIGAELLSKVDAYSSALSGDKINSASTENKNLKADADAANQDKPAITVNNNKTTTTGSPSSGTSGGSDDTNAYQRKLKG
jgi:predicted chitinase